MAGYSYRSLVPLTRWVGIGIWTQAGIFGLSLAITLYNTWRILQAGEGASAIIVYSSLRERLLVENIIATLALLFSGVITVLVLVWIFRANKNLHARNVPALDYTPGWAVGWFFVPVASLWKPYQVLKELWAGSTGRDETERPLALDLWYGLYLLSFIFHIGLINVSIIHISFGLSPHVMAITGSVIVICKSIVMLWLIKKITVAQEAGGALQLADVF